MERFSLRREESGIIAILVTMMMIIVVSLVVVSLAQLSRHEQRLSLDNQLGNQAYYAAESGIDDAKNYITTSHIIPSFSDCNPMNLTTLSADGGNLSGDGSVRYTCVKINPRPSKISGPVVSDSGSVYRLKSGLPYTGTTTLQINWTKQTGGDISNCPSGVDNVFSASSAAAWNNCPIGVLRFDLTNVSAGYSPATLANNTLTVFAVPQRNSSSGNVTFGYGVNRIPASCDANSCTVTVSMPAGANEYYINARLLYQKRSLLTATRSDGDPFVDSQIVIDSTGKAQDVLRRVQVSLNETGPAEDGCGSAICAGDGICKLPFVTGNPGNYSYSDDATCGS